MSRHFNDSKTLRKMIEKNAKGYDAFVLTSAYADLYSFNEWIGDVSYIRKFFLMLFFDERVHKRHYISSYEIEKIVRDGLDNIQKKITPLEKEIEDRLIKSLSQAI